MFSEFDTSSEEQFIDWIRRSLWMDGCDIVTEHLQAAQEGRDLSSVEAEFQRLKAAAEKKDAADKDPRDAAWYRDAGRLVDRVQELPFRKGFIYSEPSDLEGIRAARAPAPKLKPWKGTKSRFLEKLHGGLLGRMAGCMLGKPFECWEANSIKVVSESQNNWPLQNYLRASTKKEAAWISNQGIQRQLCKTPVLLRETIDRMVEDDDINYTALGHVIVKYSGANFTPLDVAGHWLNNVPIFHTCTAERVAYRNFIRYVLPPKSASYRNPYREWIGAQIRADYFGYANPGDPERAAEWAWRDACVSHIRNGIYGEMWVAAMLAAACVEDDWLAVIRAGLAQVPRSSRLFEDIEKIIRLYQNKARYADAIGAIHKQWNESVWCDWTHTNSNAQIVAAALLFGEDDYEKTITRAVMPGFDTDCNGATAGSLWGIMHGAAALPKKWTRPLKDRVQTGVAGYVDVKISALAGEMVETALKNRK